MKRTGAHLILIVLLPFLGLAEAASFRIEQVTVVSPERTGPLRNATVVVRDDRIAAITTGPPRRGAANETVIDGKGLYLTPGLIDSHVHLSEVPGMRPQDEQAHPEVAKAARAQIPRSYLLYGYTTLVDLISTPQMMAAWNLNEVRPDTSFCGAAAVVDGYGMGFLPKEIRYRLFPYMLVQPGDESRLPAGIDPAAHTPEAVITRMQADGATCVKAFSEDGFGAANDLPTIKLDVAQRLVRAAHAAGMLVYMHANAAEHQAFALEAGADIIAHGMWHWGEGAPKGTPVTPGVKKILDRVVESKVGWQPTMQVLYGERDLLDPDYLANPALARVLPASLIAWYGTPDGRWFRDSIATFVATNAGGSRKSAAELWAGARAVYAGFLSNGMNAASHVIWHDGRILFGTDTPSAPTYANPPGLNGLLEMRHLVAAGMTPAQVFRAATLANAEALRMSGDIGTVEAGKRANLLLMRDDPTRSVEAYAGIVKVIVGGRVLEAADLAANRATR